MSKLPKVTVSQNAQLRHIMQIMDDTALQIALVIDDKGILKGTVTDGDIRRALLNGFSTETLAAEVMNSTPKTLTKGATQEIAQKFMYEHKLNHVPIIDNEGYLVSLTLNDRLQRVEKNTAPIILMAGGLGMRLRPLTEHLPKPMIPIGDKPLLEQIINQFAKQGFYNFTLSLNYLGHLIKEHFGDGTNYGVKISYIEEKDRMGTGGALSLLEKYPDEPFIVMNGDILTTTPLDKLLKFHIQSGSAATICARSFSTQIPYGVLNTEGTSLTSIEEKPVHKHLINAGIYVLSPVIFDQIRGAEAIDMPELITRLQDHGLKISVLEVNEYWMDIGRPKDLERARTEYAAIFEP